MDVKNTFYEIVKDAQTGITLNISEDDFSYVRFNYIEEGNLYGNQTISEYIGNPNCYDEVYDAEYSNGTSNYLPTLKVENKKIFFNHLTQLINKYIEFYQLEEAIVEFGENNLIKDIVLTILSNARYVDYENPVVYMDRYINFFDNYYSLNNEIENISLLENSNIITNTKKEKYGYETPYCFETIITNGSDKYYLPNINYGISNNTCYIYAVQNKHKNEDTNFNKKIKRNINKINSGIIDNTDYDKSDTVLGVPPSFVLALLIFLKTLKNNGIDNIEVITFLPDRYFEKTASEEYDADLIQNNLTQRLVLLFYRIKEHINDIEINYPVYDGISNSMDNGENLLIKLNDIECSNNELIEEVLSKFKKVNMQRR